MHDVGVDMKKDEISEVRLFFYEIVKESFQDEPDAALIDIFNQLVDNLKKNYEVKDEKVEFIIESFQTVLQNLDLQKIKEEYNILFVDPFSNYLIHKNASFYIENKNFGNTLVKIRDFIWRLELFKSEDYFEPEDSVPFISDVMIYLIDNEYAINVQYDFFTKFIAPLMEGLCTELKNSEMANFYACVGLLMEFFIEMERNYLCDAIINA
ncbi:MAG: hypothetical protein PWQ25_1886 [Deferribacteres bacterium]|jgi:TorA maturation chaperone TorD|nr:hypothetical protein [Deferribacteraceae bacterium]MDK2793023.1 hypothetical protein [Deferribacteres bacterium]